MGGKLKAFDVVNTDVELREMGKKHWYWLSDRWSLTGGAKSINTLTLEPTMEKLFVNSKVMLFF